MKLKIKAYCKKSRPREADGHCPLYILLKAPKKREVLVFTGKHISPKHFNNTVGLYEKGKPNINDYIRKQIEIIEGIVYEMYKSKADFSVQSVKQKYLNPGHSDTFIAFAKSELEKRRPGMNSQTHKDYQYCLSKIEQYAPNLTFQEVTPAFLEEYKAYQLQVKSRKPNGVYHDFATMKKFWRIAMKSGLVHTYPFDHFTMPKEKTQKGYLVKAELNRLWEIWEAGTLRQKLSEETKQNATKLSRTLYYFLLSCYTGLRLTDMRRLSDELVTSPGKAKQILTEGRLTVSTSKSAFKKQVHIPIHKKLATMLQSLPERPLKQSNSRVNADVKALMQAAGIDKHITFHSARHTFGVVSKELGIDTATLRDLLGHSSITTTEIYEKIVDDVLIKAMSKWDEA